MRRLKQLIKTYRQHSTAASDVSMCTAVALLIGGGIAISIDRFVTPWADGPGLLWIGGFYLVIGIHGVLRKRAEWAREHAIDSMSTPGKWGVGKMARVELRNQAARESS